MIRPLIVFTCIVCVATILSELVGLGFLWYRGQLTSDTVADIRDILSGQYGDSSAGDQEEDASRLSSEDILEKRTRNMMNLSDREKELSILKSMVDENAGNLSEQKKEFENNKQKFDQQLAALETKLASESAEQTRAVLLKLPAPEAVLNLMELDLDENIVLLKGMPEKNIAELLGEFLKGDQKQIKRGHEIFESLSRGEPAKSIIDQTREVLTTDQIPTDGETPDPGQ